MGVANNHSLAWGIASSLSEHGASLAFTYQGESFKKRVQPLAESVNSNLLFDCDVTNKDQIESTFSSLSKEWGGIDFIVHGIAYSDRNELTGRYIDTSKENFLKTLEVSCFSLTDISKIAEPSMNEGGSILTLSFGGSSKVMPNYNVMGVAKAALEASVRYLAVDYGKKGIRVNAISAGPMRTLSGAGLRPAPRGRASANRASRSRASCRPCRTSRPSACPWCRRCTAAPRHHQQKCSQRARLSLRRAHARR